MAVSIGASLLTGPICNITRTASVFACQECEAVGGGTAGIVGNIINTAYILFSAVFALVSDKLMALNHMNTSCRREEKSRKHWSIFTKLLSSVTANFF